MQNSTELTPVTILAAYVQGRKDGFAAGLTLSVGALLFMKAYKRGRDDVSLKTRLFGKS